MILTTFLKSCCQKYTCSEYADNAVKWLHACNTTHDDLQALKLADFGLSRRIAESSESRTTSEIFGVIPYIDPQCFFANNNQNGGSKRYKKKNKKSDVYSVGIILWETSSEKTPFKDNKDSATLPLRIRNELREKPIFNTYVAIYKRHARCQRSDNGIKRIIIQDIDVQDIIVQDIIVQDIIVQDIIVQDIIVQDILGNKLFDIFDMNSFTKYLDAVFKTQNVTKNSDEQELWIKLFNEGRSVSDIIINSISKGDNVEVFNLFLNSNNNIAQCFVERYGVMKLVGTSEKYEEAFNLLKSAAEKGKALTMNTLRTCYQKGYERKLIESKDLSNSKKRLR
ncbi:45139_t:CDS:2 [Gigaspora margarita]|uniref:45139_t:CDS:1 n=1 Tax=Gigaspora margarita TaxID=4874 RepID=A0ABM8W2U1_GIGMA|nr:45139_t:CDS:2 [Gigaspora margarita]